ncbi:MAG TPA: serine hydrolase domain-containing protein [Rhizomicrobium sp.]|jgi:D-alanyl-D-alanine carboxypeptidase|nr:serine hydrolase domain-containing protein [Rhizomicrobium sp.]
MIRFVSCAAAALAAVLSTGLCAYAADPGNPPLAVGVQAAITDAVQKELKAYGGNTPVPGAVVGIWDPKLGTMFRGFGVSDLTAGKTMGVDDKFRIGSNTKTFVVTVILQLADEGKLNIDDTLDKFNLPVKIPNGAHITLRELAEMRSGLLNFYALPAFQAYDKPATVPFDVAAWLQKGLDQPAISPPGAKFNYSNTNYILLGMVIEAITHNSVASEIENRILKPLRLTNTSYPVIDPGMPLPYAHGYTLNAKGGWDDETVALNPSVSGAAGVMVSDAADMRRWVKLYTTTGMVSPASQKARLSCVPVPGRNGGFGLGIGCSAGWLGYTGGITGYNTSAYYLPSHDATVIAFVNSQRELPGKPDVSQAILRAIAKILYPDNAPL